MMKPSAACQVPPESPDITPMLVIPFPVSSPSFSPRFFVPFSVLISQINNLLNGMCWQRGADRRTDADRTALTASIPLGAVGAARPADLLSKALIILCLKSSYPNRIFSRR